MHSSMYAHMCVYGCKHVCMYVCACMYGCTLPWTMFPTTGITPTTPSLLLELTTAALARDTRRYVASVTKL